ncbi:MULTISPECIES: tripartite tricarboxylate transporter TctB family protein [Nocardioides]|uniref:Tripartite tricarboxylate transporter TctB family protein n=1 Tax=Nocardioides vastitatis TaxID=2568655 RepID=A0ABW0ZM14_9ACTN|nr:tripartite tricarboxylate transporter TctB family protein [Nocardioides sp.]THI98330.1 tripartite tricarboxylate transporter TctB family protein [Nocardioides sp.]
MSDERTPPPPGTDILEELEAEVAEILAEERPPAGGPAYQVVGALVAVAVGVGGVVLSLGYGLGSLRSPGPGLWPFVVSVVITGMALAALVVGRHLDDTEAFTRASVLPVVGILTFVVLGLLMPVIGFEIPSLLLCVIWLRFLGGETWRSTAVVSVATVAAFYFLFLYGLRIPLPHLF